MAVRGRKSLYTKKLADNICDRLSNGDSLFDICDDQGMPAEATVRLWVLDDREGFAAKYARARDIGLDIRAERIKREMLSEPDNARARLIFDHERWYLSKMAPKRFGDRLEIDQKSTIHHTHQFDLENIESEELAALAAVLDRAASSKGG